MKLLTVRRWQMLLFVLLLSLLSGCKEGGLSLPEKSEAGSGAFSGFQKSLQDIFNFGNGMREGFETMYEDTKIRVGKAMSGAALLEDAFTGD